MGKRTRIQRTQTKKHANNTKKEGPVPLFWAPCVHALETHFCARSNAHYILYTWIHLCPKSIMIRTFTPLFATDPSTCSFSIFWQPEPGKKRARGDVQKDVDDAATGGREEGEMPTTQQGSEGKHRCGMVFTFVCHTLGLGVCYFICAGFCVSVTCSALFLRLCVCSCVCVCVCVCKLHMSLYILHLHGSV